MLLNRISSAAAELKKAGYSNLMITAEGWLIHQKGDYKGFTSPMIKSLGPHESVALPPLILPVRVAEPAAGDLNEIAVAFESKGYSNLALRVERAGVLSEATIEEKTNLVIRYIGKAAFRTDL
jgi:hypothetical protein